MRTYVLQIVGLADGRWTGHEGRFVRQMDVDARGGRGVLHTVEGTDVAKHFDSARDALEYWKRASTVVPLRPDGKPNRPLTAYTVEVVPVWVSA